MSNSRRERPFIRVAVADRHPLVHLGVRRVDDDAADLQLVGEAQARAEALHLVDDLRPDVLVVARRMYLSQSGVRILVLSAHGEEPHVFERLACGVFAFLTNEEAPEVVRSAIDEVAAGQAGRISSRTLGNVGGPSAFYPSRTLHLYTSTRCPSCPG